MGKLAEIDHVIRQTAIFWIIYGSSVTYHKAKTLCQASKLVPLTLVSL